LNSKEIAVFDCVHMMYKKFTWSNNSFVLWFLWSFTLFATLFVCALVMWSLCHSHGCGLFVCLSVCLSSYLKKKKKKKSIMILEERNSIICLTIRPWTESLSFSLHLVSNKSVIMCSNAEWLDLWDNKKSTISCLIELSLETGQYCFGLASDNMD